MFAGRASRKKLVEGNYDLDKGSGSKDGKT